MKRFETARTVYLPYLSSLSALAFPVMLEQLGQIFLGTVDTFFAGQIGDNAIAAVNVTNMFMNVFITVFTALGIGIMVKVAHALGEKDRAQANHVLRQAILLGCAVGLCLGILGCLGRRPLIRLAGAEGEIFDLGAVYFSVVCLPCVFLCLTQVLASGLKAAQNTRASMVAAVGANLLNAVLDALFIFMGWGIFGLGLATSLARAFNVLFLARYYFREDAVLTLDRHGWKPDWSAILALVRYSGTIMLTRFSARLAILVHGSLILRLGSTFYVANSITTQIDEFACVPSAGFEAATATMVSNALGGKRPKDASRYAVLAFVATAFWMTVIGAVLAVFAVPLASLFTETVVVRQMVRQILVFMVFFNWTSALSHIFTSAVQGCGDSRYPLAVTLLGNIVMRLGAGYVLAYYLGWDLIGIWSGIVLDFLLRGTLLVRRFSGRFRGAAAGVSGQ